MARRTQHGQMLSGKQWLTSCVQRVKYKYASYLTVPAYKGCVCVCVWGGGGSVSIVLRIAL